MLKTIKIEDGSINYTRKRNLLEVFLGSFFCLSLFVVTEVHWLTSIGLGFFVYLLIRFLREVGNDLPFETLILLIACLQWIVGPALSYHIHRGYSRYYMYVPEQEYMKMEKTQFEYPHLND